MEIHTLAKQFCDYSSYMLGYTPATIRRYRIVIQVLRHQAGLEHIEQCTHEALRAFFYRGRAERHWSANTFIVYHSSLTVFFRWCLQHGHLPASPIEGIAVPKVARTLPPKLTQEECRRLLECVENYPYRHPFLRFRNHAIFATFLLVGLRLQELRLLQVVHVDIPHRSIFVRRGKGAKDRIVPMSPTLAATLERYAAERTTAGKTCPEFFTALHRNAGLGDGALKQLIVFARRISGVAFSAHKLRHAFATLMLEGGCDIFSLSRMLGHSDIKTTTIYLAATAEHLRGQIAKHPLNYAKVAE